MRTSARGLSLVMLLVGHSAVCGGATFAPGDIYTPLDGGTVVEWNSSLQEVRQFSVPGVQSATGATFDDLGRLVFIAEVGQTTKVLAVNPNGTILASYDTGDGGLLRGSYIDFDPTSKTFVFADDNKLTWLDDNLSPLGSSAALFSRASGVIFDSVGNVYATDQFNSDILKFASNHQLVGQLPFNSFVSTGLDYTPDNALLVALYGNGEVDRLDLSTNQQTTVIGGLGFGAVSDVQRLANGNLLTIGMSAQLKLYSPGGTLLASNVGPGTFGDGMAVFVPEPHAIVLAVVGGLMAFCVRFKPHSLGDAPC